MYLAYSERVGGLQVSALVEGLKGDPHSTVRLSVCTLENDNVVFDQTKGIYLTETNKYKERWADNFNKTIKTLPKRSAVRSILSCACWSSGPIGWGESDVDPFVRIMQMSVSDQWNDMYLAHAYPFLYARKLRYVFASHWWERFLSVYGKFGLHILVLVFLTLVIVGGYRTLAKCDRFAPTNSSMQIFARQVRLPPFASFTLCPPSAALLPVRHRQYMLNHC
jgi:hypothetical protein